MARQFVFSGGVCVSILLTLMTSPPSFAGNMPLQVIAPRPAGSGSPAIPSSHRIFYAYPGIEYKIRAAVVGGDYPYSFALSNAPTGMTVDAAGYIRWANPQSTSEDVELRITDSAGHTVNTTWSIHVQTAGFRFVDVNAGSNGNGSIGSPHNSIAEMAEAASPTDIVYFRGGIYRVPARGGHTIESASGFRWDSPSDTATRWLAHPGEDVTIDLGNDRYFYSATDASFYFEGLTFYRGREYFFRASSSHDYVTFLDNTFDTLTLERTSYNSNQGAYFTMHNGAGHFLTFQGNVFRGFRGTQGIGSLYDQKTILVENNRFSDFDAASSTNQVLAFKVGIVDLTFRGNVVDLSSSSNFGIMGGSTNAYFGDGAYNDHGEQSRNIEVLYNYFRHAGAGLVEFNRRNDMGSTWIHRNTFACPLQMTNLEPGDCDGPWTINNNVFQNEASGVSFHYSCSGDYESCIASQQNLGAPSGLIDSDGKLLNASGLGTVGWQFPDGTTPFDRSYSSPPRAPTNLEIYSTN